MKDGEKSNWQGQLFTVSATSLVNALLYKEIFSGKDGIDMLATSPVGYPDTVFIKPYFAPEGNTAFEFTSQYDKYEPVIDELSKKVSRLKDKHKISGGVIVSDIKVSDKIYNYGKQKGIFLWDVRDASFLSTKILAHNILSNSGNIIEKHLTNGVSYLWCIERPSTKELFTARVILLVQPQLAELSSSDLDKYIKTLKKMIEDDVGSVGVFPLLVRLSIFCRSYTTRDFTSKVDKIVGKYSREDRIVFDFIEFLTFYVSPWNGCLNESILD